MLQQNWFHSLSMSEARLVWGCSTQTETGPGEEVEKLGVGRMRIGRRESLWRKQAQACAHGRKGKSEQGTASSPLTGNASPQHPPSANGPGIANRRMGYFPLGQGFEKKHSWETSAFSRFKQWNQFYIFRLEVPQVLGFWGGLRFSLWTGDCNGSFRLGNATKIVKSNWNSTWNSILCRRPLRSNSWTQETLHLLAHSEQKVVVSPMLRKQQAWPHRPRTTCSWKSKASFLSCRVQLLAFADKDAATDYSVLQAILVNGAMARGEVT